MKKDLRNWKRVKFQNFPLALFKETKGSNIYIFGGRYYSVTGEWGGVSYSGRYRFHVPPKIKLEDVPKGLWDLVEKQEEFVSPANGEKVIRIYYTLQPTEGKPQHFAAFLGGHFKTTLSGYGRDRDYKETTSTKGYEVIAQTSNSCRSGRFGAIGSFVIAKEPIEIEPVGVF